MTKHPIGTPKPSFGRQIMMLITFAIVSLAVVGSITAAYFISNRIANMVLDQGLQVTKSLAHQSILPLLSGMAETAEHDVKATLRFPNVQSIIIYDKSGKILVNTGYAEVHNIGTFPKNTEPFKPMLLRETEHAWEFMATVYDIDLEAEEGGSLDELYVRSPELLGYVVIQTDKSSMVKIQGELLLESLYVFLGLAVTLLAVSILVSQQMTNPLDNLAKLMKKAEDGEEGIRSEPHGPLEIYNMARAFNTMMDALEQRQAYAELQHQSLLKEIAERQLVEQNLRDSETNLVSIFNNVVDGIVILDDNGSIETANPSAERILQRPVELFGGKNFFELLENLNSSGEALDLDLHKLTRTTSGKEHVKIQNEGRTTYLDLKFSQMFVKGVNKFIVILIDVTISQRQQNRIEALLAQHETVVSNVPGFIVEINQEDGLVWWNKYTEKVTGFDSRMLKNIEFGKLVSPQHRQGVVESLDEIRRSGRGELHADILTESGSVPYQLNASVMKNRDSDDTSLLIVGLDDSQSILAQKALKEARDAALDSARIKSEFLANMSHEIRTPMNGMFGMLQLLSDCELNEEQRGYADIALRSAEQLLNIINDILDFSKIEAGKLELERVAFSPRTVVEDIVELFTPKCQYKDIQIFSKVDVDIPREIFGDPTKLNQIISNLVGNAVKFTDHGHVLVSCYLSDRDSAQPGRKLIIEVVDTGVGIESDAQDKIFDSFIQADGSSTRRYSGTGLGLAIVKQLVELMGGHIELKSVFGEGSRFIVTLPLDIASPEQYHVEIPATDDGTKKVLYFGASEVFASILKEYTRSEGYSVVQMGPLGSELDSFVTSTRGKSVQDCLIFIENRDLTPQLLDRLSAAYPPVYDLKLCVMVNKKGDVVYPLPSNIRLIEFVQPLKYKNVVDCLQANPVTQVDTAPAKTTTKTVSEEVQVVSEEPAAIDARILVVEDNDTNLRVISSMLNKLGYEPDHAKNGKEALKVMEDNRYNVVFMDCQMPVMDGYQATQAIRDMEKVGELDYQAKIIAMTGNAMEGDRERCIEAGMDDYMAKPVRFSLLKKTLEKWLA